METAVGMGGVIADLAAWLHADFSSLGGATINHVRSVRGPTDRWAQEADVRRMFSTQSSASAMKIYHVFHVSADQHLVQGPELWCQDDGEAVRRLERLCAGHPNSEL